MSTCSPPTSWSTTDRPFRRSGLPPAALSAPWTPVRRGAKTLSTGLIALLDDVAGLAKVAAASLDDAAGQAARAGAKA
ncbi:DUF808 family protein, partial [Azospirillum formosense]|uniref:DUF808 family protein n=1 Tax=Azospirillum formosense TaxID=861533 RepID=UPI001FFE8C10